MASTPGPDTEVPQRGAVRPGLALTSLGFAAAVGIIAALDSLLAGEGPRFAVVWWVAYGTLLALLLLLQDYLPRPRWMGRGTLLVALVLTGMVLVVLFASEGSAALVFVLTSAMTSFFCSQRAVAVVITAQTGVVVVAGVLGGWPIPELVMLTLVFALSQLFSAIVVQVARREEQSRRELGIAHDELRATAALLELTTREAERVRIARDLHDLAGHHLTALSLELEVASHLISRDDAASAPVLRARSIAKELLGSIRAAVTEMRGSAPPLGQALGELVSGLPGLDVTVRVEGERHIAHDQGTAILRCVQESITNTLRHGDAHHASVEVRGTPRGVDLAVTDDGRGVARFKPGHGLTGMRERVEMLGGTLDVTSRPGTGFTLSAHLPPEHTVQPGVLGHGAPSV